MNKLLKYSHLKIGFEILHFFWIAWISSTARPTMRFMKMMAMTKTKITKMQVDRMGKGKFLANSIFSVWFIGRDGS